MNMAKKTLRGKRHIRARASVQVGREKRRYRKIMREINSLYWFINVILPEIVSEAVKATRIMIEKFSRFGVTFTDQQKRIINELSKTKSTNE